jgi:hypothetical protein
MDNDFQFRTREYIFENCRGENNMATGPSEAGGFLYGVRVEGYEAMEIRIKGDRTKIGSNHSHYNNTSNPGGALQKRGNVVIELSGSLNSAGLPEDRVNIFGDVPNVPSGIVFSVPTPNNRAVTIISGGGRPDQHPTHFTYANILLNVANISPPRVR